MKLYLLFFVGCLLALMFDVLLLALLFFVWLLICRVLDLETEVNRLSRHREERRLRDVFGGSVIDVSDSPR